MPHLLRKPRRWGLNEGQSSFHVYTPPPPPPHHKTPSQIFGHSYPVNISPCMKWRSTLSNFLVNIRPPFKKMHLKRLYFVDFFFREVFFCVCVGWGVGVTVHVDIIPPLPHPSLPLILTYSPTLAARLPGSAMTLTSLPDSSVKSTY